MKQYQSGIDIVKKLALTEGCYQVPPQTKVTKTILSRYYRYSVYEGNLWEKQSWVLGDVEPQISRAGKLSWQKTFWPAKHCFSANFGQNTV